MSDLNGLPELAPGIGVDMFDIGRMERALKRRPSLKQRLFTKEEQAYCDKRARPAEHYAARFAAREAVVKALGCGFQDGISVHDVSVILDGRGRPQALLSEKLQKLADQMGVREIALSLSHTRDVALANALLVTEAMRPKLEEKTHPAQDLAQAFKQARSLIADMDFEEISGS